jgi:hypothetical protein
VHLEELLGRLLAPEAFDMPGFERLFACERRLFMRLLDALERHGSARASMTGGPAVPADA